MFVRVYAMHGMECYLYKGATIRGAEVLFFGVGEEGGG
jgi:hypothetical protein